MTWLAAGSSPNTVNGVEQVELLRSATREGDQQAQACLQQHLSEVVRKWLRQHPGRETLYRLQSEDYYAAGAFERFWQVTLQQQVECSTITEVLCALQACLNSILLEVLRTISRSRAIALPEPGLPGEPQVEDATCASEVWEHLQGLLPNAREQRLAYLLFYCGLETREIMNSCPHEFGDVHEIAHLRYTLMDRLLNNIQLRPFLLE